MRYMAYEGFVKYSDGTVVSTQCADGRHGECADIANHAPDGPDFAPALDGHYCECSCPEVKRQAGPKPTVTYDGVSYKVRSYKTEIPDLDAMDRMGALIWLNQNTYATGNGIRTKPNLLAGLGGAISLNVR